MLHVQRFIEKSLNSSECSITSSNNIICLLNNACMHIVYNYIITYEHCVSLDYLSSAMLLWLTLSVLISSRIITS